MDSDRHASVCLSTINPKETKPWEPTLSAERKASVDEFEDGDGIVIPSITGDRHQFGSLTFEKNLCLWLSWGWDYQFIVESPIDQYSPLSTCCISSGTMASELQEFRVLEHVTASPQDHSWIIPSPSSFTGCHQGACSGNSSRSLHQAMSLLPWYPPWRAPRARQLRRDKRRAAGFDAGAVPWWWWCEE